MAQFGVRTVQPIVTLYVKEMVGNLPNIATLAGIAFSITGVANIIVRPDLFARDRLTIVEEPFLIVDGVLQNQDGVTSVRAEQVLGRPFSETPWWPEDQRAILHGAIAHCAAGAGSLPWPNGQPWRGMSPSGGCI